LKDPDRYYEEGANMNQPLKIGIIGDYDPQKYSSHIHTNESLRHAGRALSVSVDSSWLSTPSLTSPSRETTLKQFDALWCAPGSPYKSMEGALLGIQFAREKGWPFFAT
jgi:CTP synthase (UTP-ammonia lyase)